MRPAYLFLAAAAAALALGLLAGRTYNRFFEPPDAPAAAPVSGVSAAPAGPEGSEAWGTDFGAALSQARARNCRVLIAFTGSDWCEWCKKMDAEVYSQAAFARFSRGRLVLLKLDYPEHTPQPEALRAQNAKLREKYGVHGFPTSILTDASGKILLRVEGYQPGGPEHFIEVIQGRA